MLPGEDGAHGVEVVLAGEQQRQIPQGCEVRRLVELPLGEGSVAEEATGDAVVPAHAVGEGEARGQREPVGDDRAAAVEAAARVEQVHGSAAAPAAAGRLAVHLGHDGLCGDTAGECVAVFAVGGDHRVLGAQCLVDADGDGLLADVEVDEAADLRRAVELDTSLLEASDA